MIRNILYSLFLHSIIALLVYTNLSFYKYSEKDDKNTKNTLTFLVKLNKPEKTIEEKPIIQKKKKAKPKKKIKKQKRRKQKPKKEKIKKIKNPKQKLQNYPKANKDQNSNSPIIEKKPDIIEKKDIKEEEIIKSHELPPLTDSGLESEGSLPDLQEDTIFDATNLSLREKFNIQTQIKRCYKKAIEKAGVDGKVPINATIIIEKDGKIDLNLLKIKDFEKYHDPKEIDFHIAVDNVINAITFCSPLRNLPTDKYEIYRELNLIFDDDGSIKENKEK